MQARWHLGEKLNGGAMRNLQEQGTRMGAGSTPAPPTKQFFNTDEMTQTSTAPMLKQKTTLQEEREARDLAIYNEYNALVADPNQSRTQAIQYLMGKYNFHSNGTVYVILKRVEERVSAERKAKKGGRK